MKHIQFDAYQQALAQASKAFVATMGQQGYVLRDYPENFIAALQAQTQLAFEPNTRVLRRAANHVEVRTHKAKITRLPLRSLTGMARTGAAA